MARGTPTYSSGSIPSGGGTRAALMSAIITQLTAYQSNGEQAWALAKQYDTGIDYEAVFHSVGDRSLGSGSNKGDTDIWVRFHRTDDDLGIEIAQDFSTVPASWASGAYRTTNIGAIYTSLSDTVALDWFCVVNEYEFVFILTYGGFYKYFSFGSFIRPYSVVMNGVARITSQSGTGNGVVIGLDRDISSNLEIGQTIWLLNQTPDAGALQSVGIDLVLVTAKSSNSVTVDNVVNTYAVGSLAGLDPAPSFARDAATSSDGNCCQTLDGSYTGVAGQSFSLDNPLVNITESDNDPGPDQLHVGTEVIATMNVYPRSLRGKLQHHRVFTLGLQADQDIMKIDFDAAQQWKVFITSGAIIFPNWVTGIGPGAT